MPKAQVLAVVWFVSCRIQWACYNVQLQHTCGAMAVGQGERTEPVSEKCSSCMSCMTVLWRICPYNSGILILKGRRGKPGQRAFLEFATSAPSSSGYGSQPLCRSSRAGQHPATCTMVSQAGAASTGHEYYMRDPKTVTGLC